MPTAFFEDNGTLASLGTRIGTMLHAFVIKNARRIFLPRQAEHQVEKAEDAATSMVFSPLTFMTAPEALKCLTAMLGAHGISAVRNRRPIGHVVELWPGGLTARSAQGEGKTRCEPDLVVTFRFSSGPSLAFIGEMKWGWPMPVGDLRIELDREIEAVSAKDPKAEQVVFVVSKYQYPPIEGVTLLTWRTVFSRLRPLISSTSEAASSHWADLISRFLAQAGEFGFSGFPISQVQPGWAGDSAFYQSR